jgi:hypothetical protein
MPAVRDKDAVTGNGHVNQGQPGGLGCETHREIGDRESRRHVHGDIENAETPMRGLTKVMC